jgi:hypothetical protein
MTRLLTFFILGLIMATSLLADSRLDQVKKNKYFFRLLNTDNIGYERVSIDAEASRKFTKLELTQASRAIYRTAKGHQFKKFFITWYLPGMKIGAGAWATTNYTPDLRVTIMDWMLEHNPPAEAFK